MVLNEFLKYFKTKSGKALDSLIVAEEQLNSVLKDTNEAFETQKENAVRLLMSHDKFVANLNTIKHKIETFKAKYQNLIDNGCSEDDHQVRLAKEFYTQNTQILEDLMEKEKDFQVTEKRLEKTMRKLKYNKEVLEAKDAEIREKIASYKMKISEINVIEVESAFSEISQMVDNMKFDNEASGHVNALVNGRESESSFTKAGFDSLFEGV